MNTSLYCLTWPKPVASSIMECLLVGISDDKTREELLSTHDLSKSIQICRAKEVASLHMKALRNEGWRRNLREKRLVKTNIRQRKIWRHWWSSSYCKKVPFLCLTLHHCANFCLKSPSQLSATWQPNLLWCGDWHETCQFPSWLWLDCVHLA